MEGEQVIHTRSPLVFKQGATAIALPQNTRPSPSGPQRTPSPNQSTVSHRTAVIAAVCVVAACTLLLIVLWRTWRVRRPSPPLLQVSLSKPRLWDILSVRADAKAEPWTMWARMLVSARTDHYPSICNALPCLPMYSFSHCP